MAPESFLAKGAETGQFVTYSNAEASNVKYANVIYANVTYAQTASRQHYGLKGLNILLLPLLHLSVQFHLCHTATGSMCT